MRKTIVLIILMFFIINRFNYSYGYSDISDEFWGYDNINELTSMGFLSGYPDGTFRPNDNMTIAEFTTLLMKVLYPNIDTSCNLGYWASESIELAKEKKIIVEKDYSEFIPDKEITRREICLMIYRSLEDFEGISLSKLNNKKKFIDVNENNFIENRFAAILSHLGILSGYPDGTVRLERFSSRAETCAFISNFIRAKLKVKTMLNDNESNIYENGIAVINAEKLPFSLKKWQFLEDIPYVTTEINSISIFPFNEPIDSYKDVFDMMNNSSNLYLQYRKKFGKDKFVIAVEFDTTNNTSDSEVYTGSEFLHITFPEEEISIIDAFDTGEIDRQIKGDASVGCKVKQGETQHTSAFYVIDKIPKDKIRFDRSITDLYNIEKNQNLALTSFHSLIVRLESR